MPEQILLPGFEPEPNLTDRLLFVVLPDATAIAQIVQRTQLLREEYALRGRSIIPGRLHVSLLGLGDFPDIPQGLIKQVSCAADRVVSNAFDAGFDFAKSFLINRSRVPVVLVSDAGIEGIIALQQALIVELQKSGLPLSINKSFTPHLTLLYDVKRIADTAIEPVTWVVREFVLVHSLIGKNQPYTVLGRWTFTA